MVAFLFGVARKRGAWCFALGLLAWVCAAGCAVTVRAQSEWKTQTRGDGWSIAAPAKAGDGKSRTVQVALASHTPVEAGGYAFAKLLIPNIGSEPVTLSFLASDDYGGATAGYQFAVVRVNGVEVWSRDTAGGLLLPERVTVQVAKPADATGALALEFGISIRKAVTDFPVQVEFSDAELLRGEKRIARLIDAPANAPAVAPMKPRPAAVAPKLTTDPRDSEAMVGVAKVDVTPDYPVRLNGFGGRRTESEGVTHKIFVKALAIGDDPKSAAVLLTVDNLGIPDWITRKVSERLQKKFGLDPKRLTITFTHTHTAPMLRGACSTIFGLAIPPEHQQHIDKYSEQMVAWLEEAATRALESRVRSRLSWSVGQATFSQNRRTPNGPVDHDLPMLFVRDLDGKTRAIYTSYACHCVTLGDNKISGDWAGYAAESLEKMFPGAVALLSVGCGADSNPSSGVTNGNVEVAAAQGRMIAEEIKRLSELPARPIKGHVAVHYERITLPLQTIPSREQWQRLSTDGNAYVAFHAKTQLAKLDRGEKLRTAVDYPVQTWIFGDDLAMVFLTGEVVVDYSLRLKRELDHERVWMNGYSNDFPFYIPSERVLREGGYEGGESMIFFDMPARFAPGLEEKIIDAVYDEMPATFIAAHDASKTGGTSPLSPERSLAAIRVRPGMTVELVAAEPLVVDPVAIDFGADGRLWVAEMHDYPAGIDGKYSAGGRVKVLTDANNDGRYDHAMVFLDGIPFPTGVTVWHKGVLVCTAPDILYAEDTNGDGKADVVKKLFTGFATHNYQARVNSLQSGLDNWVYASTGLFGGKITGFSGKKIDLTSRDFRMKPDTGEIEAVTGQTQQSRVRDDWGNWFGCDNGTFIRHYPVVDRYVRRNPQFAPPATAVNVADYPNSNRVYPIAPLVTFKLSGPPGFATAACGVGIYRDELLGKEFYGNSFTCEPVNQVVHRLQLSPRGATFSGRRAKDEATSEFLASSDNWFRPVQARTGPDGALWVVDMYRYVIEHPIWIPPEVVAKLDVRAGDTRGRIYRVFPKDHPPRPIARLDRLDVAGLVAALDSPNGPQRDLAQQRLVNLQDRTAAAPLAKLARESQRPQTRLQALCTLDGLGALAAEDLERALADVHQGVRRHAIRLAERFTDRADIAAKLAKMTGDADPQVCLQLAYSLGEFAGDDAAAALAELCSRHRDDEYLVAAAMSSLRTSNLRPFARHLLLAPRATEPPARVLAALLDLDGAAGDAALWSEMLQAVAAGGERPPRDWQLSALAQLLRSRRQPGASATPLSAEDQKQVDRLLAVARQRVADDEAAPAARIAAIQALGVSGEHAAEDQAALAELLSPRQSVEIQLAAVAQLNAVDPAGAPRRFLDRWAACSPAVRSAILDALLGRSAGQAALIDALQKGTVAAGDLDAARRQRLLSSSNATVRTQAEKLLTQGAATDRKQILEAYTAAASTKGDATRGQAVFAKTCATCHRLGTVGAAVGPDLAALASKPRQTLLTAILDPNQAVDPRYLSYQALTNAGTTISGLLSSETAASIVLTAQDGKQHVLLRKEIDELKSTGKSLMPEGLEKDVSQPQMTDLLAFLTSVATPPKSIAGNTPATVRASADGVVVLSAKNCEIRGPGLVLENEFHNLGMWNSADDHANWTCQLDAAKRYQVFLEYACDDSAAGNSLLVESADKPLRVRVASTGAWSRYRQISIGELSLPGGASSIALHSDGAVRGALLDLGSLQLVPHGAKPHPTLAATKVGISAKELAAAMLNEKKPSGQRERLVAESVDRAGAVIAEMTKDLPAAANDKSEEYRRIPWIWRVAIGAGKRNDADALAALLSASLPSEQEPLRDWQAVAVGGGVINGLTQAGVWPQARVRAIIAGDERLAARWSRAIELAAAMADDPKIAHGTRYDALRMLGADSWKRRGAQLAGYLKRGTHAELQMGAVSALGDIDEPLAAETLLANLDELTTSNRSLALDALLRSSDRAKQLLEHIAAQKLAAESLGAERAKRLKRHDDAEVRRVAERVLP
jgi:putative membrane-bound dehydrogenase-like protein